MPPTRDKVHPRRTSKRTPQTKQNEQEKAQTPSTAKRTSKRTLQKRRERAGESPKPRTRKEENEQKKAQDPPRRSGRSWRSRTACGQMNGAGAT